MIRSKDIVMNRSFRRSRSLAKDLGCRLIQATTYDFHTKEIYEQLGYKGGGELKNYPKGHSHCNTSKILGGAG